MSRVLIVDDDAAIRDMTRIALEIAGHAVTVAASGSEALHILSREPVDVILLDVRMPLMDGAEFVRRYRSATTHPAPVIVFTAARNATLARGDLAAARYLEKPFELDDLLAAIEDVSRTS